MKIKTKSERNSINLDKVYVSNSCVYDKPFSLTDTHIHCLQRTHTHTHISTIYTKRINAGTEPGNTHQSTAPIQRLKLNFFFIRCFSVFMKMYEQTVFFVHLSLLFSMSCVKQIPRMFSSISIQTDTEEYLRQVK